MGKMMYTIDIIIKHIYLHCNETIHVFLIKSCITFPLQQ